MRTEYTFKSAIERSISHNEIVKLETDDVEKTLQQIKDDDETVESVEHVETETGIDAWGEYHNDASGVSGEFRILIVAE